MGKEINLNKSVYNKLIYEKTIDSDFSQLGQITPQEEDELQPTVDDFFALYNELFYEIPEEGSTNSHEYLINKSSEYINFESNNSEIQALTDEITQLREELLDTQQRLVESQLNNE